MWKEGTDIQEGKCSWVVLAALSMCTEEEKEELKKNYGKKKKDCIARVREIFANYDIQAKYEQYEQTVFESVKKEIESDQFPIPALVPILRVLAKKLFGRY